VLRGNVQLFGACLGGEHNGGKPGRGSENKMPIVAVASLDEAGHPIHVKVAKVEIFSFAASAGCAQDAMARGCEVFSDGASLLPCCGRGGLPSSASDRYLGAFCYRFNRRFNLEEMTGSILRATCNCTARP
jgi:hypothetical protein